MKLGQKIYLAPQGNAARYNKEVHEDVITKIGRVYFETKRHGRFNIQTMQHDNGQYSSQYQAFFNTEDYQAHIDTPILRRYIENKLYCVDYKRLLEIKKIIEQNQ